MVRVKVVVETADRGAAVHMFEQLLQHGYVVDSRATPDNESLTTAAAALAAARNAKKE